MVEMRPLIGKEQLRNNNQVSQGTGALDRDEQFVSEYDPMLQSKKGSVGREVPFTPGPWMKPIQQNNTRTKNEVYRSFQGVDLSSISKKEADILPELKSRDKSNTRNLDNTLQRSQVIKPTTVSFPINLPI